MLGHEEYNPTLSGALGASRTSREADCRCGLGVARPAPFFAWRGGRPPLPLCYLVGQLASQSTDAISLVQGAISTVRMKAISVRARGNRAGVALA